MADNLQRVDGRKFGFKLPIWYLKDGKKNFLTQWIEIIPCNPWVMRGPYRTATKLVTMHVARAKQPKHRRERRAQARVPHARRGIHGGEKPWNAIKPGCGRGKSILAARKRAVSSLSGILEQAGSFLLSDEL